MITSVVFAQVDHPLIIIAQIVASFYLFRLFFALRKSVWPLPQMVAALAFAVLTNLVGRVTHAPWFAASDIIMFSTLAAVIIASVNVVKHAKAEAAQRPGAPVVVTDFFDRIETKVTWGVGLLLAGVLIYYCVDMYQDLQRSNTRVVVVAKQTEAKVRAELTEQLCETQQKQDSLLAAVTSISATQGTIIANQNKNSKLILDGQQGVRQLVSKQNQQVKKTIQSSVIQARPLETTKPKTETQSEREKQNIWQRFKGLLKASARRDSISGDAGVMPVDTLVFQR